jgi:SAM-dependent methyltransferase
MDLPAYREIVQRNARRWEAMAHYRQGMTLDQHRAGVSALEPEEWELLGDLRGQRVLHLACSMSDEGISMAARGATVTGIDIAPTHIRAGRAKAAALGADVTLRVGDMMQLDADLGDFDLVYISTGGLCWVPDLDDWLVGVRTVLKAAGRLLISEHHPLWETLGVAGERHLVVLSDYFGTQELTVIHDPVKSAIGTAETADDENPLQHFIWGIGAVVSALIRHDFEIKALLELPDAEMYRGLGAAASCIPAVYRLMATRR